MPDEFVRRAGYALIWALTVHDKTATDAQFLGALRLIEAAEPDARPLVRKAMDMALRALGKRTTRYEDLRLMSPPEWLCLTTEGARGSGSTRWVN